MEIALFLQSSSRAIEMWTADVRRGDILTGSGQAWQIFAWPGLESQLEHFIAKYQGIT